MANKQKTPNPPCKEELGVSDIPLNSLSEVLYDKNVGVATLKAIVKGAYPKDNHHINLNNIGLHIMKSENQPRMLRMKQLTSYTSLSRGYIYQKINEGTFPPGHMISQGIRAWEKTQVDNWLDLQMGRGEL
jgi:predicted DNA-binding transcriptional regulator AlpA